ncbi:MAG TPA: hypothetical protein VK249_23355, partial [Anaerolineales bacterium]|nr:hypothetical protein [Anaerolineales bacterium]
MDFQSINKGLSSKLRARGYAARVIPIHRLENLKDEIEHHYQQGMFNAQFFQERLAHFDFDQPIDMP